MRLKADVVELYSYMCSMLEFFMAQGLIPRSGATEPGLKLRKRTCTWGGGGGIITGKVGRTVLEPAGEPLGRLLKVAVKSSHGTERNSDKHMLTRSYVTSE